MADQWTLSLLLVFAGGQVPLSVVIPSRNCSNLIPCVAAVRRHEPEARIIVVDDGLDWMAISGSPLCVDVMHGVSPFIFARNCNLGIQAAGDDDVVLLNDDAILESPSGFTILQRWARIYSSVGLMCAVTNSAGNPEQLRRRDAGFRFCPSPTPGNSFATVAYVCVMIPRRTINTVGLLDERFGGVTEQGKRIYGWEDNDYSRRIHNAGMHIGIADGCFVDHLSLKSTFRGEPNQIDMAAGHQIYLQKWGGM